MEMFYNIVISTDAVQVESIEVLPDANIFLYMEVI